MGVTSTTLEERALFSRRLREERPIAAEYEVVRRSEVQTPRGLDRDPLAPTLAQLAEHAPSSKHLERIARAQIRANQLPKLTEMNQRRAVLVLKELDGTITPAEHARLDSLNWHLEQIEEGLLGDQWDLIQAAVAQQAALAHEMHAFIDELKAVTPNAFRARK